MSGNVYDLGAYRLAKAAGEDGHMPAEGARVFAESVAATSGVLTQEALERGFQAVVREDSARRASVPFRFPVSSQILRV